MSKKQKQKNKEDLAEKCTRCQAWITLEAHIFNKGLCDRCLIKKEVANAID